MNEFLKYPVFSHFVDKIKKIINLRFFNKSKLINDV